jgi:hypothetical protein
MTAWSRSISVVNHAKHCAQARDVGQPPTGRNLRGHSLGLSVRFSEPSIAYGGVDAIGCL